MASSRTASRSAGHGSQVEEDKPLLDAGHDRRIALSQGLGQRRFRTRADRETAAKRRRPRSESAEPARSRRPRTTRPARPRRSSPSSAARRRRERRGARPTGSTTGVAIIDQSGIRSTARSASRARRKVASSAASVILSRRKARMSGSLSTCAIASRLPTMMPHCGPAQQLVAGEEHEVGAGGDAVGGGRLVGDAPAAALARARPSRCRRSSTGRARARAATSSASSGSSVKPTIRKLLRWTRRIAAVSGPIARS